MKKFLVTGFYFSFTAAVCAACFWFPSALSKYQDEQIYAKVECPAVEPMTLTYSSSLYATLRLLSNNYYSVEYPYAGSMYTESQIFEIASRLLKKFEKYGLLAQNLRSEANNAVQGQSATLSLAIASSSLASSTDNISSFSNDKVAVSAQGNRSAKGNPSAASSTAGHTVDYTTAAIWDCSFYFQDSSILKMFIDDKSGKLVGFNIYNAQMPSHSTDETQLSKYASAVAKFLKAHYGMKARAILENLNEEPAYDNKTLNLESTHSIRLTDGSGDTMQLKLINKSHEINFN